MIAPSASHLYHVGETVILDSRAGYFLKPDTAFTIIAQLPPLGSDLQYRIKSMGERHERVVLEHQLTRTLSHDAPVVDFPWNVTRD
jgi:hypothetical protein